MLGADLDQTLVVSTSKPFEVLIQAVLIRQKITYHYSPFYDELIDTLL